MFRKAYVVFTACVLLGRMAFAQSPAQTFYVPFPEPDALTALQTINVAAVTPITTYISIAAIADGTIIYYDHWEDGYENVHDLAKPLQPTTQIWGDGNPANGFPPGVSNDLINAGTVILLFNRVDPSNPQAIDYDARDKIVSTRTVSLTRTYWADGSTTLMAGCVEVFSTSRWGTDYRVPVGEDIPDGNAANIGDHQMFEYTALSISAAQNGTTVWIDKDNNGTYETTNTLNEGETIFVNGGVYAGGRVTSSKPVQVILFTGDVGSNYESRDSSLLPVNLWSDSYYSPVSTPSGDGTRVWLYNPGTSSLTVSNVYRIGTGGLVYGSTDIAAGSYASVLTVNGAAYRFYSSGNPFYAYSTTDSDVATTTDNQAWDWSFTLIPKPMLSPQVLVGLGIGRDPTSAVNTNENGNPIWITPVGNGASAVTVYIDYNGDDKGAYTDPYGNKYDFSTNLLELQQAKIYDPDGDQTAMLIYVLQTNVTLAAAWGQDTTTATAGEPGLDVGTSIPPEDVIDVTKNLAVTLDADGDGLLSPSDRAEYLIRVGNTARAPIPADVIVKDALPEDTTYVVNSTYYRTSTNGTWTAVADNSSGTAFPLDDSGFRIAASIPVGGAFEVRFQVNVDAYADLTPGMKSIVNTGSVTTVMFNRTVTFYNDTALHGSIGDRVWYDADGDGVQDAGEPGISGVTVYLDANTNGVRDAGEPYAVTTNGFYLLQGTYFEAGTYVVKVDTNSLPAGLVGTYDLDGTGTPSQATVTLTAGQDRTDVDFGFRAVAQLSGSVLVDTNGNGVPEAGETAGLAGVTILLLDSASNTVASALTSASGFYQFQNIATGSYFVVQILPSGYTNTYDVVGPNDRVIPVMLSTGQSSIGNDFYDWRPGSASARGKVLYLSDPDQALDRVDPVATGDSTPTNTATLSASAGGVGTITVASAAAFSTSARTAASHTFSYSSGSTGANRILMVGISYRNNDSETVSAVTYGGAGMTLVGTAQIASGTPDGRIYIFCLTNPPTGNNNLQVNWNSALNQGAVIGAITYAGVDQTAPTGTFSSASATSGTAPSVTVSSATNQLVFGVVGGRSTSAYTVSGGGTSLWSAMPYSGQTAGSGQSKTGAVSSALSWTGISAEWVAGGVSLKPAAESGVTAVTFTQSPAFALPFTLASNTTITVTNYVNVISGTMPANPAVTARLSAGGSTFLTLTGATYNSGSGTLVWTGSLSSAVSVAAGSAIAFSVSNGQSGVTFQIRYDSSSYPSKIILPTASVIAVPSLGLYDAPYPSGVPVTNSPVGSTRYVRVTVTDPFGAYDISGVNLSIDAPGTGADILTSLTNASVVASNSWSKTYEYAWSVGSQAGETLISATAVEGTEGITATASVRHRLYSAALFGYLFKDNDSDLLRDTGDSVITNALVRLYVNGALAATTLTDSTGYYRFDDIPLGTASVVVSRASATLIDVPSTGPAASDARRNRGLPKSDDEAFLVQAVFAGYGVLPETPGETLNFGFVTYPLSAAFSLRIYATGQSGARIELWTVNESGVGDIVLYAWLNGAWTEVGRVPADEVVGEGSNRYILHTKLLSADSAYYFRVVDETGVAHELISPVEVRKILAKGLRVEAGWAELTFGTEYGCRYQVFYCSDLSAEMPSWEAVRVSVSTDGTWSKSSKQPFVAGPGTETRVRVETDDGQRAYYKIVLVDED